MNAMPAHVLFYAIIVVPAHVPLYLSMLWFDSMQEQWSAALCILPVCLPVRDSVRPSPPSHLSAELFNRIYDLFVVSTCRDPMPSSARTTTEPQVNRYHHTRFPGARCHARLSPLFPLSLLAALPTYAGNGCGSLSLPKRIPGDVQA